MSTEDDSNLIKHAKHELKLMGMDPDSEEDDMDRLAANNVLDLLRVFSSQGHSGFSAPYVLKLFTTLASFEPAAPLTGEDDEWQDVSKMSGDIGPRYQNKRCGRVFKDPNRFNGQAYDIEGKVFEDPDGNRFTNGESAVPVTFPYRPTTEYVKR